MNDPVVAAAMPAVKRVELEPALVKSTPVTLSRRNSDPVVLTD